jgi:LytS/YehU family sensor histidine kinase
MGKSVSIHDKWIRFILHAIGWIIVIAIPLFLSNSVEGGNPRRIYEFYLHAGSAALIFYLGYLWLVPSYFIQNKQIKYFLILVALILATYFLSDFVQRTVLFDQAEEERFREAMKMITGNEIPVRSRTNAFGFFIHFLTSILLSGFAIGLGMMDKLKQNEKVQKELEKEKLNSELAFLKNQVSPHFFFNTLNNIYSLIGIDAATAQESVLKLSKLMRYLLYESDHGETLMSHEIDFLNNYIDLMKLRLSPKVELQVDFPKDFADFSIPPLLFVSFVENAFKHGISHRERSFIHIRMAIEDGNIRFDAENSVGKSSQAGDMQHSGIGLENVRKRLGLLFPERHSLEITEEDAVFKVHLIIQKKQ